VMGIQVERVVDAIDEQRATLLAFGLRQLRQIAEVRTATSRAAAVTDQPDISQANRALARTTAACTDETDRAQSALAVPHAVGSFVCELRHRRQVFFRAGQLTIRIARRGERIEKRLRPAVGKLKSHLVPVLVRVVVNERPRLQLGLVLLAEHDAIGRTPHRRLRDVAQRELTRG